MLPAAYLTNPQAKHDFVYVCTIQRMAVNLFGRSVGEDDEIDDDAEQLLMPHHAFDIVIADECHRGYGGEAAEARKVAGILRMPSARPYSSRPAVMTGPRHGGA